MDNSEQEYFEIIMLSPLVVDKKSGNKKFLLLSREKQNTLLMMLGFELNRASFYGYARQSARLTGESPEAARQGERHRDRQGGPLRGGS